MDEGFFAAGTPFRIAGLLIFTLIAASGFSGNVKAQATSQVSSNELGTEVAPKSRVETPPIKVDFDPAPGVVIVESNGVRLRVDALKKTVEKIGPASSTVETAAVSTAKEEKADKQDEDQYEFESGHEPYDYRLVNVPTPKKVPKGTWNLSFTHRFTQPIHPIDESARELFGLDSFSVSAFGVSYGITDKLYVSATRSPICQRGLCRTIELGVGYHWIDHDEKSPFALTTYASIEGNGNFTEEYTYNLQAMMSQRVGKRMYLFFSPAVHINANGQGRFDPRPSDFFPPAAVANSFKLPAHGVSYGFGASVLITPSVLALFDFTPRTGFKLGQSLPTFGPGFSVAGFEHKSYPSIGFGLQKNIGRHAFTLTLTNTQTTTTSRYNSSNLLYPPRRLVLGFNLARRF